MLEKEIQASVIQYLRLKKYFCWKNNTVGIYKKSTGQYIPSQSVGSPDIFVVKKGIIYGLEIKSPKGKTSPDQVAFGRGLILAGGEYAIIHSIDDLIKIGL